MYNSIHWRDYYQNTCSSNVSSTVRIKFNTITRAGASNGMHCTVEVLETLQISTMLQAHLHHVNHKVTPQQWVAAIWGHIQLGDANLLEACSMTHWPLQQSKLYCKKDYSVYMKFCIYITWGGIHTSIYMFKKTNESKLQLQSAK